MMNIEEKGGRVIIDWILAIPIPEGAVYEPETDETYASINHVSFGTNSSDTGKTMDLVLTESDPDPDLTVHSKALASGLASAIVYQLNDDINRVAYKSITLADNDVYEVTMNAIFTERPWIFGVVNTIELVFVVRVRKDGPFYELKMNVIFKNLAELEKIAKTALEWMQSITILSSCIRFEFVSLEADFWKALLSDDDKEERRNTNGIRTDGVTPIVMNRDWSVTMPAGYLATTDADVIGVEDCIVVQPENNYTDLSDRFGGGSESFSARKMKDFNNPLLPLTSYGGRIQVHQFSNDGFPSQGFCEKVIKLTPHIYAGYSNRGDGDECYFRGHIITRDHFYMPQIFFCDEERPATVEEAEKHAVAYFQSIQSILDGNAPCDLRYYVDMNRMIPETKPSDPQTYAFYTQVTERNTMFVRLINQGMVPNDSPEYQFQSFEAGIKPPQYLTAERAWEFSKLFRVNSRAFNYDNDRQSEIQNCIVRWPEQISLLRSFAWCVGEYCEQTNRLVDTLHLAEIQSLCQLIETRNYLCYRENSHYPALCSAHDVEFAYALYNESDHQLHDEIASKLNEEISTGINDQICVGNLGELRAELTSLLPAIEQLADYIKKIRKTDAERLEGVYADVVYVWSSFALAATNAFCCDHSLMGYDANISNDSFSDFSMVSVDWYSNYQMNKTYTDHPEQKYLRSQTSSTSPSASFSSTSTPPIKSEPQTIQFAAMDTSGEKLMKGMRFDITQYAEKPLKIRLYYQEASSDLDIDGYAFCLWNNEKVHADDDLIFFGNPKAANQSVWIDSSEKHPALSVVLNKLTNGIQKVAICFSAYGSNPNQNFSKVSNPAIQILCDGKQLAYFPLTDLQTEKTITAIEIYKRSYAWKIRCVGMGYRGELKTLCESYGLEVE